MSRIVRLSDVAEVVRGVTYQRESAISSPCEGYIPVLRAGNIQDQLVLDEDLVWLPTSAVSDRQLLRSDDVLMCTSSGSADIVGKSALFDAGDWAGSFGAFCAVIRPNPSACVPAYLKHVLRGPTFLRWARSSLGANIKNIRKSELELFEFHLPTRPGQQRIACILDKTDSLCRKRKGAIELAGEFLRAVFYEKFGDPVANPNGFPTNRIDQVCDVATGSTPARNRADYYDGPHPWIKTGEVDTPLITSAEEHISDAAIAETNCKLFPVGTLLIAMYGQGKTRGKVGMLGIPAATNQACAAILPSQKINRHFLYTQLSLMYEHLRAMGRGGNQENLNLGMIKSLEVIVPPVHLIDDFLKVRERVRELISKARKAEADSEAMFKSLVAKLLAS
jgi:type I restriction enzyme S subunit